MPYFIFFLDACCLMIVQFQSLPRSISSVDDLHIQLPSLLRCLFIQCRPYCQGLHIMALGWEAKVPELLKLAGI